MKFKPNTVVVYDPKPFPGFTDVNLPVARGTLFLYTGEITNMKGHGVFWEFMDKPKTPKFFHLENFRLPNNEEF